MHGSLIDVIHELSVASMEPLIPVVKSDVQALHLLEIVPARAEPVQ